MNCSSCQITNFYTFEEKSFVLKHDVNQNILVEPGSFPSLLPIFVRDMNFNDSFDVNTHQQTFDST